MVLDKEMIYFTCRYIGDVVQHNLTVLVVLKDDQGCSP
jgi:hypothetical protein